MTSDAFSSKWDVRLGTLLKRFAKCPFLSPVAQVESSPGSGKPNKKQIQLIVKWTSINQLGLTTLIVEVLFSSVPNLKIPSW